MQKIYKKTYQLVVQFIMPPTDLQQDVFASLLAALSYAHSQQRQALCLQSMRCCIQTSRYVVRTLPSVCKLLCIYCEFHTRTVALLSTFTLAQTSLLSKHPCFPLLNLFMMLYLICSEEVFFSKC